MANLSRSRRQNFFLILTLGILNALTPFSIDMYLPAFPAIARELGVPVAEMALTVSVYFIGFALAQVAYGPLLDRFGRKLPLYLGLSLYILATVGCLTAPSMPALLFFRFLSATGGCAASVGATAMVRDFFPPESAAKIFSLLMLVLSASPLLAPTVGSLVVTAAHWRMIFAILAGLGCLNLLLVKYALPAGQAPDLRVDLRPRSVLSGFRQILRVRQFFLYSVAGALSFTGLFVYVAGSPAIFLDGFHLSAKAYGGVFAFLAAGVIGGGQLNHLFARKCQSQEIFRWALLCEMVFSFVFLAAAWIGADGLFVTIACLFLILLCAGIAGPNAAALALASFSENIGSASALLGFTQLGIGSITSACVGLFQAQGSLPMAAVMSVSALLACLLLGRSVWLGGRVK